MTPDSDPEIPARFCHKTTCTAGAVVTITVHGLTAADALRIEAPVGAESEARPMCDDHFKLLCYGIIFPGLRELAGL